MTAPELRLAALSASLRADASGDRLGFADLAVLLAPVSAEAPAGEWLRYDPIFDALREARREDDASTPQGIWSRDLKRADWNAVHDLASQLIAQRSKDLQIAAWLLEAWVRLHGFAGARMGFELLLGLCEHYWPDVYPLPDDDDLSARVATIEWVNERLPLRLFDVPVTQPTDLDGRAWAWNDRREALRRENLRKRSSKDTKPQSKNAKDAKDDWLTMAKFTSSAASTPRAFLAECAGDVSAAQTAVKALERLLDDRCGAAAPSLSTVSAALTEIRQFLGTLLDGPGAAAPGAAPAARAAGPGRGSLMTEPSTAPAPTTASALAADHAATRTEAYRKLAEAADTLMRIEPHSPTPYLVRRAIAWGGMSLAELMRHFIDSGYDLKTLYTMLGMGGES